MVDNDRVDGSDRVSWRWWVVVVLSGVSDSNIVLAVLVMNHVGDRVTLGKVTVPRGISSLARELVGGRWRVAGGSGRWPVVGVAGRWSVVVAVEWSVVDGDG